MPDGTTESRQIANIESKINREVSGAIALSGSGGALSIAPRNMGELFEFAKMMAVSGPCVRPQFRGNPGACLALALQAFRTGADPFAVANKAYITISRAGDEQIAYEAQYIHAVLNNSGKLKSRLRAIYSGEAEKRKCKIIGHVVDEDEPLEYESPTIAAIAVKNSPLWKGDPDQQLFYYSSRAWGRRHLPEVLLGMYTPDEIRGEVIDVSATREPDPPRPKPEDFIDTPTETQAFEVVDFTGEPNEYQTEMEAMEALAQFIGGANSLKVLEALVESNAVLAAYPVIIEAYKDRKEVLSNPGDRQDRPAAGAATPDAAVTPNTSNERPRDEPKSLAVPVRKSAGKGADWQGTAEDMVALILELNDLDDVTSTGRFMQANRDTLDSMRVADKSAWGTVMYRLGDRERVMRTGEQ